MNSLYAYREQWTGNVRGDILAGALVALWTLIHEANTLSIDHRVGSVDSARIRSLLFVSSDSW